jgi:hypothetical protein
VIRPDVVEAYMAMASGIPEAGGDGVESILLQIIQAEDPAALDAPWRADGLREFINRPLRIDGSAGWSPSLPGGCRSS